MVKNAWSYISTPPYAFVAISYLSTEITLPLLTYILHKVDESTVTTANYSMSKHLSKTQLVYNFPAMNTETCCAKRADNHCFRQLYAFHHSNYQLNVF